MKLQIEIELGERYQRVFDIPARDEAARILHHLADDLESLWGLEYLRYLHRGKIKTPPPPWVLKDINGKAVGHARIIPEDPEPASGSTSGAEPSVGKDRN